MTINTKYVPSDVVYLLEDNQVRSGRIHSIMIVATDRRVDVAHQGPYSISETYSVHIRSTSRLSAKVVERGPGALFSSLDALADAIKQGAVLSPE